MLVLVAVVCRFVVDIAIIVVVVVVVVVIVVVVIVLIVFVVIDDVTHFLKQENIAWDLGGVDTKAARTFSDAAAWLILAVTKRDTKQ